jgi:hypothetical protein
MTKILDENTSRSPMMLNARTTLSPMKTSGRRTTLEMVINRQASIALTTTGRYHCSLLEETDVI